MSNTSSDLYEHTTTIPGRSSGAYIFYNDDTWTNAARETVPENCARLWETRREYWVRGEPATFHFAWGRCDQTPNEVVLDVMQVPGIRVYPTIVQDELIIEKGTCEPIDVIQVTDLKGNCFSVNSNGANRYNVQHLQPGLYLLRLWGESGQFAFKFIKE